MSVFTKRGSPIGRPGPATERLSSLYRIVAVRNGQASNTFSSEIVSSIAFGDPILQFSSGSNFDVMISWSSLWKATFASFANPSTRLQIGLNGGSLVTVGEDEYTGGGASCATVDACSHSGKRIYSLNSGDRRLTTSNRNFAGVGYTLCDARLELNLLVQLKSGSVAQIREVKAPWSSISVEKIS